MGEPLGSRYVLEEALGHGGMGTVHRAAQRSGGPDLAVKLLQPAFCQDPKVVARFVQERSIMLGVAGDHVVRVHDMVVEGDKLAIVMDYVPDGNLRSYLAAHAPLSRASYLDITSQVLVGLVAVHDAGIVHRDIKPANLLVDSADGQLQIKVSDFGISRVMEGPHLTSMSSSIGTPTYMAPELVTGAEETPAADVYAVGILLYEMVAGQTPFAGPGGPMGMLWRHANVEPEEPPGVDRDIWDLIARFLQPEVHSRYLPSGENDGVAAGSRGCSDAECVPSFAMKTRLAMA
jgi:serine/threonine-protein kinase